MLRAIILALSLFIGANAGAAQDTSAKPAAAEQQPMPAPKAAQPSGRISGIVICSDTQKPGRGIRVNIARDQTPGQHDGLDTYVMTDSDGRYLFDRLKPGDYFVRIHANGYLYLRPPDPNKSQNSLAASQETSIASTKITLRPNEAAIFDVTLQRSASISGYVYFDDGSPAMGAEIRVEQTDPGPGYKPEPGEPSYMSIARFGDRGLTDERGYFRITTLGAGTYRIAAAPMFQTHSYFYDFNDSDLETERHYPESLTVFSGDTIHRAQAKTYKLRPGEDVSDIRITIPLAGFYKVGGTTSVVDGRTPNKGVATLVDESDHDIHFRTELSTDGNFDFATIPAGTYKLTLSHLYIAGPDHRLRDYSNDDAVIDSNAFSGAETTIIVKNSDILDLHFEVHEIPMPPQKPDDNDP